MALVDDLLDDLYLSFGYKTIKGGGRLLGWEDSIKVYTMQMIYLINNLYLQLIFY